MAGSSRTAAWWQSQTLKAAGSSPRVVREAGDSVSLQSRGFSGYYEDRTVVKTDEKKAEEEQVV